MSPLSTRNSIVDRVSLMIIHRMYTDSGRVLGRAVRHYYLPESWTSTSKKSSAPADLLVCRARTIGVTVPIGAGRSKTRRTSCETLDFPIISGCIESIPD